MTVQRKNKMKIAVQIFGHMRTFEQCAVSLRDRLLDRYDCDVFIHTWDVLDHHLSKDSNEQSQQKYVTSEKEKIIWDLYDPKVFQVQSSVHFFNQVEQEEISSKMFLKKGKAYSPRLSGVKNMLYSMISVNQLRRNYEKEFQVSYDYVIFMRPDIFLKKDCEIDLYRKEFEYNNKSVISFINHPMIMHHNSRYDMVGFSNDIFFILLKDSADRAFDLNTYLKSNFGAYASFFPETAFSAEALFFEYLAGLGLICRNYSFPYNLVRFNKKHNGYFGSHFSENYEFSCTFSHNDDFFDKLRKKKKLYKRLSKLLALAFVILVLSII